MNSLRCIRKLTLLALAAASLSACAPLVVGSAVVGTAMVTTDRRTTGTQVEDTGIETKATFRIRQAMGSRSNINAQAYNRVLLLTAECATTPTRPRPSALPPAWKTSPAWSTRSRWASSAR